MTTFGELVDQIHTALHSYTGLREQSTWLTSEVDASTTDFPVQHPQHVFRGAAEIEDELIFVDTSSDGTLSLAPFGRGYRDTTATTHAANTQLTFDPTFPRKDIRQAINQQIGAMWPQLYQVKEAEVDSFTSTTVGYSLPDDCESVLAVDALLVGPSNYRTPLFHWNFDSSNKAFNVFSWVPTSDQTIRVLYQAKFGELVDDADTLADAGLEDSWADILVYGVCAQMVRFLDVARLQPTSTENLGRATVVSSGDAGRLANQLYAMHQQRLAEERVELLNKIPPRIHFTGR